MILDECKAHMMGTIVCKLTNSKIILEIFPGGYMGMLQVMDVGLNHPFKSKFTNAQRKAQQEFIAMKPAGSKFKPTCQDILKWVMHGWDSITKKNIVNTW